MKKRVAVVGATGIAGQQFLAALDRHPWFEVVMLAASERSAGKTYAAAIRDAKTGARRWWGAEEPPADVLALPVENGDGLNVAGIDIVFSAVESEAARLLEPQYAKTAAVLSTASGLQCRFGGRFAAGGRDPSLRDLSHPGQRPRRPAELSSQRRLRRRLLPPGLCALRTASVGIRQERENRTPRLDP